MAGFSRHKSDIATPGSATVCFHIRPRLSPHSGIWPHRGRGFGRLPEYLGLLNAGANLGWALLVAIAALCGAGVTALTRRSQAAVSSSALEAAPVVAEADRGLRRLADAAYEGLVVVQDGGIIDANAAFCKLVGAPLEALTGRRLIDEILFFDDETDTEVCAEARREGAVQPRDGSREIPVEVLARKLDEEGHGDGEIVVLAIRDLTERRSADEKIRYLAEHDALTGLPNRTALQTQLAETLERAQASGEMVAVICVDLDQFKEANDLHGQAAGDALLMDAAARLASQVVAPSFAARLGADEFVLVQIGGEQPSAAGELANAVIEAFTEPCYFDGKELAISATLGVTLFPEDGRSSSEMLANADLALVRAKENARGSFRFFSRDMDDSIRERRALARDLKDGIERDELVVYYQPLALAASGEVASFEALVRWNHPVRGLIPPFEVIAIAEEYNLIGALGEWVLRRACAEAASWEKPLGVA
ncbi:MAG: diguanylate phosphodiesterase, partial [Caulobacteraceae bacterium]|nr:diguanylate phosphodiesterase [Caulobacteraceae bacterium]